MKKMFARLASLVGVLMLFGVFGAATARANPASLGLGASFKPWNSNGVTQALTDVQIDIATVGIPNKTPIQGPPYNGNHLVGVDCPGPFCRPSTNNYSVDMRNGFAGNYANLLGAPGSQYRGIQFNDFAWCGVNYYGPGNLAPGEFKMQVTINPLPGVQLSPHGGRWVAYWQWVGGSTVLASDWVQNNSVYVPANNGNLSQVFFVYEEYPPKYTIQGYKIDRYANPNGQYSGAGVDVDGWQITDNPFYFTAVTANQSHTITADNTSDWDATGWLRQVGSGTPETGNGRSLTFGNQFEGTVWDMRWYYEPKPSTIQAGILVRDPATGTLSNPCNQSGYQAGACDNAPDITVTRRFALPSGTQKSYNAGPTTVTPGRTSNGSADVAGLYADDKGPAAAGYTVSAANIPAGWRIVSTVQCGQNTNRNTCYTSAGQGGAASQFVTTLTAWRYRPVFFVLEPNQITVKGDKKGPGTFNSNQNSDTTNLGTGTIDVAGQTVSGNNQAGAWNRAVNYNSTSGTYGVRAVAPAGWQIRGYAYCVSATQISSCASNDAAAAPNNQTQGQIILEGNGQTEHTVTVNYQGTTPNINGVSIPTGGQVWVTFFFKPAPVTIQVRGKIDMQGGNTSANTDLNPCNYNDYKRNICTDVEVRPVRMNTVGVANTATPGTDLGDPAGGYGNCASKDYIPTKPGYDYGGAANTGFYCTTEGGNNRITQAQFLSGQGPLRYGYTLDARTGQISQNGNSSENNLAIVRNVYPGKYSFRHNNGPEYNNESAYDISQSTCAVGQADCSSSVAPNADISGCLLNHRRKAEFTAVSQFLWWTIYTPIIGVNNPNAAVDPNGQNYCTIMWSGAPGADSWSAGGSPESWNIGGNTPRECAFIPTGGWAYFPQWNTTTGQYGINAQGNGPCGYRKDSGAAGVNTYSMGVPVGTDFREQTFYYAPKFKTTDEVLTCDTYTANLVYMPDPSRPVTTYFRINGNSTLMRTETSIDGDIMKITTQTTGPDAYKVNVDIPKYNGRSGILLKDGNSRQFEMFARYSDSSLGNVDTDLVAGYTAEARDFGSAAGTWRYSPRRVSSPGLMHQCKNDATCDQESFQNQLNAISVMDVDDPQANKIYVRMTNIGKSYWMRSFFENGLNRTTGHQLVVTGGTITSVNGSQGWVLGNDEMLFSNGTHVYPIDVRADVDGVDNVDDAEVIFEITPEPPADGGAKYVLGFQMAQNGVRFGTACEGDLDIKVSYKPWLRVQNGNVTALGQIVTQSDGARGVFKTESNYTSPYKGSVQMGSTGTTTKPALNLHAQFVVVAEEGGSNFCSTNFYMLGFATKPNYNDNDANKPLRNRNCSFGELNLNIEQTKIDETGKKILDDEPIIAEARRNFTGAGTDDAYGQCDDRGTDPEVNGGPYELSPPQNYYRTFASDDEGNGAGTTASQNLVWNDPAGPLLEGQNGLAVFGRFGNPRTGSLKLVNTKAPTGRPCPTLFNLTTSAAADTNPSLPEVHRPLGGFTVAAGRSTILSDSTVYITDDIKAEIRPGQYQFKRNGVPDTAGLNSLPNLGIIAAGDIVIASNVKNVDASLYATGRIITCDKYSLESGMDENAATKEDKAGTTGSKWIRRGGNIGLDSSPLENEKDDPGSLVAEAPNADNQSAKQCNQALTIKGSVTASDGFTLGRNYIDFAGMVQRWSDAQAGAFSQPNIENGKFCNLSTVPGIQRLCNVLGARRDFDSPGSAAQGYLMEYRSGWPQNYYVGGPAEEVIGNGLSSFLPPPGFENVNGVVQSPKYYDSTAKPRF